MPLKGVHTNSGIGAEVQFKVSEAYLLPRVAFWRAKDSDNREQILVHDQDFIGDRLWKDNNLHEGWLHPRWRNALQKVGKWRDNGIFLDVGGTIIFLLLLPELYLSVLVPNLVHSISKHWYTQFGESMFSI